MRVFPKNDPDPAALNDKARSRSVDQLPRKSHKIAWANQLPTLFSTFHSSGYRIAFGLTSFPQNNGRCRTNKRNSIRTTKYTLFTFLPVNLYNQFRRFYNLYFLLACVLAFMPNGSGISPFTQIAPLILVLFVTAVKEAVEDYHRYKSDKKANGLPYDVVRQGVPLNSLPSKDILPGDIVRVKKNSFFPADLVLLSSSISDGTCFIETSQLDGETHLKRRQATTIVASPMNNGEICRLEGTVECEAPNERMYSFHGRLDIRQLDINTDNMTRSTFLTAQQLLLRGALLRNTDFIYGLCVYSGSDTKIMKNLKKGNGLKFSSLDVKIDRLLIAVFMYNAFILIISSIMGSLWINGPGKTTSYLFQEKDEVLLLIMTYYILYTYTIPISLFVTLEIVRIFQGMFIAWDEEMHSLTDDGHICTAVARNTNLNEDLGNVAHIFSDKTGTITKNKMVLSQIYIVGGVKINEMEGSERLRHQYESVDLEEKRKNILLLIKHIATCHSAVSIASDASQGEADFVFEGESPDEIALLQGLSGNDIKVSTQLGNTIRLKLFDHEHEDIKILEAFEFNSERKRMSVLVQLPDKERSVYLFCKGADNALFARLKRPQPHIDDLTKQLAQFSGQGLRTLVFAYKKLQPKEVDIFLREYHGNASSSNDNQLQQVVDAMESELHLLGCSAIEDQLQDEVPETIEYLLRCGIKIWMLTGDKKETAINIAQSCHLIYPDMRLICIEETNTQSLKAQITDALNPESNHSNSVVVISGDALAICLHEFSDAFLKLSQKCKSVLCCRVTPMQKAKVTLLVKEKLNRITLSIGDGANDVSMIQTAHIGVGIQGIEGAQAVRASDYSFAQFKCLRKLLTVHGRFDQIRISKLVYFCLFKNILFITICFWYGLHSAWSGYQIYQDVFLTLFNVIFTSLPPIILGIFEKDISENTITQTPNCYAHTEFKHFITWRHWITHIVIAVLQSAIIYFSLYYALSDSILQIDGLEVGYSMMCWFASSSALLVVLAKFLWMSQSISNVTLGGFLLSFVAYLALIFIGPFVGLVQEEQIDLHRIPMYYLFLLFVFCTCSILELAWLYYQSRYHPEDVDILREQEYLLNRKQE